MALHCAATFLLVTGSGPAERLASLGGAGALAVAPLPADADVVDELQALADLHRGERVVVPVDPEQLMAVFEHLGHTATVADAVPEPVRLDIGDDGWVLLPTRA